MGGGTADRTRIGIQAGMVWAGIVWGTIWCGSAQAALQLGGPPANKTTYHVNFTKISVANPQVTFSNVPDVGNVTVRFGTHFQGQSLGAMHNSLVDTTPDNPLQLASDGGVAMTMFDLSHPQGLVLGTMVGKTLYTAPLAMAFDKSVSHVLFDLGHLDAQSDARIEAYDKTGKSLGVLSGLAQGFNSLAFHDSSNKNIIAGISVYVPEHGMDWEGFGLSNIGFAIADDGGVNGGGDPVVPEPNPVLIWSLLTTFTVVGVVIGRRATTPTATSSATGG